MFWLKRLKSAEDDVHWSLPYGDLMSLLLAVFVMIAAMSELRAGPQYDRIAGGVRQAFGFEPKASSAAVPPDRPMTLLERIEQVARTDAGTARLDAGSDEVTAPCEIAREGDSLAIRVSGQASFEPFSGAMKPATDRLLARLADYLAAGQGILDVRGYADRGPMPAGVPFRDAWDLSYQRARTAADVLARCGVSRDRLRVIAMGNWKVSARPSDPADGPRPASSPVANLAEPPVAQTPPSALPSVSLEIVVRAPAARDP